MESTKGCTEAVPLLYPPDVTNETARKAFKQKLLKERPETLFSDLYKTGEVSNLILFTDQPLAWHSAISAHYPSVKKEGICNGWKIKVKEAEDSDTFMMTVNLHKNGTIMVQGNLKLFEMDFLLIKERAQQERSSSTDSSQVPAPSCLTTEQPPEEKEPTSPEQVQDPQLNRTITELKVKFTELERELVQLRELIIQQPCQPTTAQPDPCTISTELGMLRQDRDSCRRELSLLRTEIRELHQDREQRLAALTALTEEGKELRGEREEHRRELTSLSKEVEELRGEREEHSRELTSLSKEVEELRGERGEHSRALTTLSEQLQERGGATQDLDEKLDHNQDPVSSQDPPIQEPTSTPSSTSSPQTSTSPHSTRPAQQREKTDIVLLIDSNGKFLNEKKLFPTHKVAKIWCPNTHQAIDLLSEERLGSPSHIIIHTGTNDLRSQQERVSESLKRVIEKASTTFPNSRVVISTLLPRKDFHPDTIHRINNSLSRDCARRPNVHLAHHPTLDISCLYDHVHLFKSTVPIFALTLKSVALNRDQSTARRKSTSAHNPHRTPRHPQPTSRPTQWRQDHPQPHPHHVQIRPHQGNHDPPQARPQSLLSLGAPPQPQRQEPHPGPLSYAQVVRRAAEPTLTTPPHNELKDIQQMLSLLCSHLIGQVPQ
ncbi:uncharacterized protein LOC144462725 [Epinephelus lanceolatus]